MALLGKNYRRAEYRRGLKEEFEEFADRRLRTEPGSANQAPAALQDLVCRLSCHSPCSPGGYPLSWLLTLQVNFYLFLTFYKWSQTGCSIFVLFLSLNILA